MPVVTAGSTTVGAVQLSGLAPNSTPIESYLNGLLNGRAYGIIASNAAVAAQHGYLELRNPLGSGRNLWVYMASGWLQAAGIMTLYTTSPPALGAGVQGYNLLTGLQNSVGFVASTTAVTVPGSAFGNYPGAASTIVQQPQPWVIVLQPNHSLILGDGNVNDIFIGSFTWMEV